MHIACFFIREKRNPGVTKLTDFDNARTAEFRWPVSNKEEIHYLIYIIRMYQKTREDNK